MPRHPPCALQHFTHNKHAQTTKPDTKKQDARIHYATLNTPPHPETHHNHHHTHTDTKGAHHGDALDGPGRERPPEKTTHQPADVFSGPNSVPNRSQSSGVMFHPATPTTTYKGCGNNKKETHDNTPRACPPYGEAP
jgi:hypothetical protein